MDLALMLHKNRFKTLDLWLENILRLTTLNSVGLQLKTIWNRPDLTMGFYRSTVSIEYSEHLPGAIGYGIDTKRRLSPLKALMEGLESLALRDSGIPVESRSGAAAHFSFEIAKKSSYMELIERDAFLFHWLTEKPGLLLSYQPNRFVTRRLRSFRDCPHLYAVQLASADPEVRVVLVGGKLPNYGCWIIGLGAALTIEQAHKKAVLECVSQLLAHFDTASCPGDAVAKQLSEAPHLAHRMRFAQHHLFTKNQKVALLLEHILKGKENPDCDLSVDNVRAQTVYQSLPVRSSKYNVVFAQNRALLQISFGNNFKSFENEYLKSARIREHITERRFHGRHFLMHPLD